MTRSRITKYICSSSTPNLLSVLDPASLACGSAPAFESQRKARRRLTHPPRTKMAPKWIRSRLWIFCFLSVTKYLMRPTRTVSTQRVPETVFRIPHPSATAKAANVFTFAACRLRAVWEEVRTFVVKSD